MVEPTHLTFAEFITQNEFALVHFWADWNPHDKTAKERLEKLPNEIRSRIAMGRLDGNVEENFALFRAHNVVTIPHLALYRSGVLTSERIGLCKQEALEEWLRTSLEAPLSFTKPYIY